MATPRPRRRLRIRRRRARRNPSVREVFRGAKSGAAFVDRKASAGGRLALSFLDRHAPRVARVIKKVPHWGWYAFGASAVAAFFWWLFRGRTHHVDFLKQSDDRWSKVPLGTSTGETIGGAGCFLTALTMAVNSFTKDTLGPDAAQDAALTVDKGSFQGPELVLEKAADALGVNAPESERIHDGGSPDDIRAAIGNALKHRGMAIVHVAMDYSTQGEHFLLVYGKESGSYLVADPAIGDSILMDPDALVGQSDWGYKTYDYRIVGAAPVYA